MGNAAFSPYFGYYTELLTNPRPGTLDLQAVHALLSGPTLREKTDRVRAAPAGSLLQICIENALPAITTAGVFAPQRTDESLTRFSRCLLLDFEQVPDVAAARADLLADPILAPELLLVFDNIQGTGFRAVVATFPGAAGRWPAPGQPRLTPAQASRVLAENFLGWAIHVQAWHGLRARPHAKNLNHACLLGYDPAAWLAPGW